VKETLDFTKYHVMSSLFRLQGPTNNPLFLPIFMLSADLDILDIQAWVVT